MDVINLTSEVSSSEEKEVQEAQDNTIREPVFEDHPIITWDEDDMIGALNRNISVRTGSPARGVKGHSKTRVPQPLTKDEVDMLETAIGKEATQAALNRARSARTGSPERGVKGHSKTRTPRPQTKVSVVTYVCYMNEI